MLIIVAFRFMKTSDGGTISFTYKSLITGHKKSRPEVFSKKVIVKYFAQFTEKNLSQSLFINKVTTLKHERDSGTGALQ